MHKTHKTLYFDLCCILRLKFNGDLMQLFDTMHRLKFEYTMEYIPSEIGIIFVPDPLKIFFIYCNRSHTFNLPLPKNSGTFPN
jgi:hypothetical protein